MVKGIKLILTTVSLGTAALALYAYDMPVYPEIVFSNYHAITEYSDSQFTVKIPLKKKLKLKYSDNICYSSMNDSVIFFSTRKEGSAFIEYKINNEVFRKDFNIVPNTAYDAFVKKYGPDETAYKDRYRSGLAKGGKSVQFACYQMMLPCENTAMPDFSFEDANKVAISNDELNGKISVINFWFVGCPACMQEIPGLNKLKQEFANESGIVFLSFFNDSMYYDSVKNTVLFENNHVRASSEPIPKFLPVNYTFRHVRSTKDMNTKLHIMANPTTLIVDKTGAIREEFIGYGPDRINQIRQAILFENTYTE